MYQTYVISFVSYSCAQHYLILALKCNIWLAIWMCALVWIPPLYCVSFNLVLIFGCLSFQNYHSRQLSLCLERS